MDLIQAKQIFYVYFTQFPRQLYAQGTNYSNMAYAGVGLGLMRCQIFFWISIVTLIINLIMIYKYNIYFLYFICLLNIFILYNVLLKTFNLTKLSY